LSSVNSVQNRLQSFYREKFPSRVNARIFNIREITEGWETEIYSFTVEFDEGTERKREDQILRIYPGNDALQKAAREFNVMKKLHELGFTVPFVSVLQSDNSPFEKPFIIMEKIDGPLMATVFLQSTNEKRQELLELFCSKFVELHTIDWRQFAGFFGVDPSLSKAEDPYLFIGRRLSDMRRTVDHFRRSEFAPVLDWLEARKLDVPCRRLSLTHGDYHPNNVILGRNGEAFVIDWGATGIADARVDLAWTLLLTSTHLYPELRESILAEYQRISGQEIEHIEYFEVMASLRRLFSILVSLSDGAGRMGMRPGAEEMMKQQGPRLRKAYDLLHDRTRITVPEIEKLLSTLNGTRERG